MSGKVMGLNPARNFVEISQRYHFKVTTVKVERWEACKHHPVSFISLWQTAQLVTWPSGWDKIIWFFQNLVNNLVFFQTYFILRGLNYLYNWEKIIFILSLMNDQLCEFTGEIELWFVCCSIGISEKGDLTLQLSVNLTGGHSSMPDRDSSVEVLAKAVTR